MRAAPRKRRERNRNCDATRALFFRVEEPAVDAPAPPLVTRQRTRRRRRCHPSAPASSTPGLSPQRTRHHGGCRYRRQAGEGIRQGFVPSRQKVHQARSQGVQQDRHAYRSGVHRHGVRGVLREAHLVRLPRAVSHDLVPRPSETPDADQSHSTPRTIPRLERSSSRGLARSRPPGTPRGVSSERSARVCHVDTRGIATGANERSSRANAS